jgi:hypothetical protein
MRKFVSSTLRIVALAGALVVPLAVASPAHADWHGHGGWHGGWGWHGGGWGCCWRGGVFIGLPRIYVPPPVYYAPPPAYYPPPYPYRY